MARTTRAAVAPPLPGEPCAHGAQRGDGRHQRGDVVGVDEPAGAEEGEQKDQPGQPEDDRRPQPVGPGFMAAHEPDGDRGDEGGQEQPGPVVAEGTVQQAVPGRVAARRADLLRRGVVGQRDHPGRRLVAAGVRAQRGATEPGQAVVAEHLREDGVVAAAVGVGPIGRRHQRDRGHPAQRDDDGHDGGDRDVDYAPEERPDGRRDDVGQVERGQDEPGLQHLGLEGEPDQHPRPQQRPRSARSRARA